MRKILIVFLVACFGLVGCNNKQNKISEKQSVTPTIELPNDFQYVITESRENPTGEYNKLFVEINQKLSKEQIKILSEKIKSGQKFKKLFINYTLPQNSSDIAWATVEFTPSYKLEITGATLEQEKEIIRQIREIDGEVLGVWYEEEYTSSSKCLYKKGDKLFLKTFSKQWGTEKIIGQEVEITEGKHKDGTKLSYKNEHGEYYVLSKDQQRLMFYNSENKCFTTALPILSSTFDTKNSARNKPLEIKGNTAEAYTKKDASPEMSRKVYIITQGFIKNNLQCPDKTKFSDDYTVEDLGNDTYFIILPIVAENKVGDKNDIICKFKLKYKGGNWEDSSNWEVVEKGM